MEATNNEKKNARHCKSTEVRKEKHMTQEELNERIKKHFKWLHGMEGGEQLVIRAGDNVKNLDFSAQDLRRAIFEGADLSFANFQHACLYGAVLDHANFEFSTIPYEENLILKLAENIKEIRGRGKPAMTQEELNEILKKHKLWLEGESGGERFSHYGENLSGFDFSGVDLRSADLKGSDLTGSNFSCANLKDAYLTGARLENVCLINADLRGANLRGANLENSGLTGADLRGADLHGACFEGAIFSVSKRSKNLILKIAEDIKESRKKKSPSDTSAQAPSATKQTRKCV